MPTTVLELRVHSGTDVLQRVIAVCRRRHYEIVDLTYHRDRIEIAVRAAHERRGSIEQWLAALIDVSAVYSQAAETRCG